MQVVYSGGSTPTPSPRLQRKTCKGYGRPVLPGYFPPTVHHTNPSRPHTKEKETEDPEWSFRDFIPAMSKPMAITCLVLNIISPGLGTFISGLSVLCCSKVRLKDQTVQKVVLINIWVALLQFLTAFILLLGWVWSIVWATSFITHSKEYYKSTHKDEKKNAVDVDRHDDNVATKVHEPLPQVNEEEVEQIQNGNYAIHHRSHSINLPGSATESQQPIIVLQDLPVVGIPRPFSQARPIMNARTRHEKILRRQMSDHELSPFNLTQEQLEDIVIHAAPIPRYHSNPDNSIPDRAGTSSNIK